MDKRLMKGTEAIAEAAVQAGCRYFLAIPSHPKAIFLHTWQKRLPMVGGAFVQAESEISAINMVYGAAAPGQGS